MKIERHIANVGDCKLDSGDEVMLKEALEIVRAWKENVYLTDAPLMLIFQQAELRVMEILNRKRTTFAE